jgi:hypothetical protein
MVLTTGAQIGMAGPAGAIKAGTQVFTYTGHPDSYTVPADVDRVTVVASGATAATATAGIDITDCGS